MNKFINRSTYLQKFLGLDADIETYRSYAEKLIQGAGGLISSIKSSSNSSSSGGITGFLKKSIQTILTPVRKIAAVAGKGFGTFLNNNKDRLRAIFPGTRWCGDGNKARSENDSGLFRTTDVCCKQHDQCPFNIQSGQSFGPLMNNGAFTRSWCTCDQEFYDCLKNANNPIAREIGHTYFTFLGPQCINYGYPIVSCLERGGLDADIETYRSYAEKLIQGAGGLISSIKSSSNSSSSGGITGFLKKSIQTILTPVRKIAAVAGKGFGTFLNNNKDRLRAIFPGTRWCGDGNKARSENDSGLFRTTDVCCKQHDQCPFNIQSGQSFGPLMNNGAFTRSWCTCDQEFYDCLKNANNPIAREIGHTYFTFLGPQCINYGYPIVSCLERGGKRILQRKCIKYEFDSSKNLTLQWFDNPDF
ncbi:uncharacterized protein LOC130672843 isoform X2 [Microplitis mediator]|uniref:uncharacterized protein LOC130672843 isoform X2 n=1 Tax=Microplitis mediator TaxID=375433 RepID=UPI00255381E0|nr:uncharacterized protein LOC130672843 isoform X2 [Microplitis mediator]